MSKVYIAFSWALDLYCLISFDVNINRFNWNIYYFELNLNMIVLFPKLKHFDELKRCFRKMKGSDVVTPKLKRRFRLRRSPKRWRRVTCVIFLYLPDVFERL